MYKLGSILGKITAVILVAGITLIVLGAMIIFLGFVMLGVESVWNMIL